GEAAALAGPGSRSSAAPSRTAAACRGGGRSHPRGAASRDCGPAGPRTRGGRGAARAAARAPRRAGGAARHEPSRHRRRVVVRGRHARARLWDRGAMDSEALRAHKKTLRTELRARRAQRYGGEQGARRRELEAVRLLEHGRPLLGEIFGRAADPRMLVRELVDRGARMIFPAAAGPELDWILWDGRSEFIESPGRGFGREPRGSRLGTAAIAQAALVLAPAVAIDRSGTRIG